jgi:hypothetical protein
MTLQKMALDALQYIENTGQSVTEAQFDDDHEPIGPQLRRDIRGFYELDKDGIMKLTAVGIATLAGGSK